MGTYYRYQSILSNSINGTDIDGKALKEWLAIAMNVVIGNNRTRCMHRACITKFQ